MSRARRIWVRAVVAAAGLFSAVGLACLDGVDYQPYFRCHYYRETTGRLRSAATNLAVVTGNVEAGFGRALFTPTLNAPTENPALGQFHFLPLAGYGARKGRSAVGVKDDLWIKAIAFRVEQQVVVLVSADALIIPREVTEMVIARLQSELHLDRKQVYLSASHSHASLGGWGEGIVAEAFAGRFQPGVRVWMAGQMVAAARAALADLSPASVGQGSFEAPAFIRNRTVGRLGRVDPEFDYIYVRQDDGDAGVLGCYGAHATVLPSSNMEFSGDYPGVWQREVERKTGGLAMFMAGGVASHAPEAGAPGLAGIQRMGMELAQSLLMRLPTTPMTNRVTLGLLGLDVRLPPENARLTDEIRLRPWVSSLLLPVRENTFFQGVRLQDWLWISTPCDFSGEMALGIKDGVRRQGFRSVVTSFNGDYIGYVVSSRYYHLAGYESRVMSFFGPCIPDYFDELIRGIGTALIEAPPSPQGVQRPAGPSATQVPGQ